MTQTLAEPMSKQKRGRPKGDGDTRMVRLNSDLADMIGWIVRIAKKKDATFSAAQLCDPLLRPQIVARYKGIESEVERIKRAEDAASAKDEESE